jgi:hypothetical protein
MSYICLGYLWTIISCQSTWDRSTQTERPTSRDRLLKRSSDQPSKRNPGQSRMIQIRVLSIVHLYRCIVQNEREGGGVEGLFRRVSPRLEGTLRHR